MTRFLLSLCMLFLLGSSSCFRGSGGGKPDEPGNDPQLFTGPSSPPAISPVDITGNDFGTVVIGSAKIAYLRIRNVGTDEIQNLDLSAPVVPFSIEGGEFPGTTGNCSKALLGPGESCDIAIEAAATWVQGDSSQTVAFTYKSGDHHFTKQVVLQAEFRDSLTLITSNIDFGSVAVGASKALELSLTNPSRYESIENLVLQAMPNSQFEIVDPAQCATIAPQSTCKIKVFFKPKAPASLFEQVSIFYEVQGNRRNEAINITGEGQGLQQVIIASNLSRQNQTVDYGDYGRVEMLLEVDSTGSLSHEAADQFVVDPVSLAAADLRVNPILSTCKFATQLKGQGGVNSCKYVFETNKRIKDDFFLNNNITITYRSKGAPATYMLSLINYFQIRKLELGAASGNHFGEASLVPGGSVPITIVVSNPIGSSIPNASVDGFKNDLPPPLRLDHMSSTCKSNISLDKGDFCKLVLLASPGASIDNFNVPLVIRYRVQGNFLELPVTLTGRFKVRSQNSNGALGVSFLTVNGTNFGNIPHAVSGKAFEIKLQVTNNGAGGNASALGIRLDRYDPWDSQIMEWWPEYFIQVSETKSSCKAALGALTKNKSCDLVLEITPTKGRPTDLGAMGRKFRISYTDDGGYEHRDDFYLSGSWAFAAPSLPPPGEAGPVWPENLEKPEEIESTKTAHPWFSYIKRPLYTAANKAKYSQSAWNKSLGRTFAGQKFMAWTFSVDSPDDATKLADIVPDRFVDQKSGKAYIQLYHGSTSEALDAFRPGSSGIRFDAAVNTALGAGFYLSADPNESKKYACERRKGKNAGVQAILLVVGVQEDAAIVGKESLYSLSTSAGDSVEPGIFFRRNSYAHRNSGGNSGMYNQFVFYKKALPYLRVLKIVKLGADFGMAHSIHDGAGKATDDTTPDNTGSYKCAY